MQEQTPRHRPTFGFSSNRASGTHRVRYREGTMVNPQECVLCIPVDEALDTPQAPSAADTPCELNMAM